MSLLDQHSAAEGELSKLSSDHNMNKSQGEVKHAAFPFTGFPRFPFLPGLHALAQDSTVPLSLNLTGQLEDASPKSAASEESHESPKSSPTTGEKE